VCFTTSKTGTTMVESLRKIAQKFELPKGFTTNIGSGIRIGGANSGSGLPGAPALANSTAGDELIAFFSARCVEMRERRQKLAERAETVEKHFASEVRAVNSLASEWKVFQKAVPAVGSISDELKRVRERVQALSKACEDIEMACTICSENLERERAEKEVIRRRQALEEHKLAAKRKNERLERSLDEKAQYAEKDSQGKAIQRVEEYKRKVEEAFDRAAKKDFSDWISGKTQRKAAPGAAPAAAPVEGKTSKPAESRPLPLEKEQEKFEKMLEGVEPVVADPAGEKSPDQTKEDEGTTTVKSKEGETKPEPSDDATEDKKPRKQKAPKVLGDVDDP